MHHLWKKRAYDNEKSYTRQNYLLWQKKKSLDRTKKSILYIYEKNIGIKEINSTDIFDLDKGIPFFFFSGRANRIRSFSGASDPFFLITVRSFCCRLHSRKFPDEKYCSFNILFLETHLSFQAGSVDPTISPLKPPPP